MQTFTFPFVVHLCFVVACIDEDPWGWCQWSGGKCLTVSRFAIETAGGDGLFYITSWVVLSNLVLFYCTKYQPTTSTKHFNSLSREDEQGSIPLPFFRCTEYESSHQRRTSVLGPEKQTLEGNRTLPLLHCTEYEHTASTNPVNPGSWEA